MALSPDSARVRRGLTWVQVPAATVRPGARMQVLPGERLALDGVVRAGTTAIDQAPITGESIPVDKAAGDQVFAGTINQHGVIEVEVTSVKGNVLFDNAAGRLKRLNQVVKAKAAMTVSEGGFSGKMTLELDLEETFRVHDRNPAR